MNRIYTSLKFLLGLLLFLSLGIGKSNAQFSQSTEAESFFPTAGMVVETCNDLRKFPNGWVLAIAYRDATGSFLNISSPNISGSGTGTYNAIIPLPTGADNLDIAIEQKFNPSNTAGQILLTFMIGGNAYLHQYKLLPSGLNFDVNPTVTLLNSTGTATKVHVDNNADGSWVIAFLEPNLIKILNGEYNNLNPSMVPNVTTTLPNTNPGLMNDFDVSLSSRPLATSTTSVAPKFINLAHLNYNTLGPQTESKIYRSTYRWSFPNLLSICLNELIDGMTYPNYFISRPLIASPAVYNGATNADIFTVAYNYGDSYQYNTKVASHNGITTCGSLKNDVYTVTNASIPGFPFNINDKTQSLLYPSLSSTRYILSAYNLAYGHSLVALKLENNGSAAPTMWGLPSPGTNTYFDIPRPTRIGCSASYLGGKLCPKNYMSISFSDQLNNTLRYKIIDLAPPNTSLKENDNSITESEPEFSLTVFPNPYSDKINFQTVGDQSKQITLRLSDIYGRILFQQEGIISNVLGELTQLSETLNQGSYFLNYFVEGSSKTIQVQKN